MAGPNVAHSSNSKKAFTPVRFGKYVLLERVGRGGMAEVFRAKTFGPGGFEKQCAIKRILTTLHDDEQFVKMFIDEARLTAFLSHANIVQILELGELDAQLFIAMEYIAGKDLLDILARCARRSKRIPRELVLYILMEVLKGLDYAHNARDDYGEPINIVHRDVSPSNVLMSYSGNVKVGDFGIAKSQMQSSMTEIGTQKGKMGYMSPEQVTGAPIDRRSDVFAAAVILFEMLSMSRLFKAKNDLDVMLKIRDCEIDEDFERLRGLPEDLVGIVRRGLQKDPDDRFQTAAEFHDAIQDFVFKNELRVNARSLEAFMRETFADRIAEEIRARQDDPRYEEVVETYIAEEASTYRYRDGEGRIHGPMSLQLLEELLASRSPEPNEAVSRDGAPWEAVDRHPTLVGVARPVSARSAPAQPPPESTDTYDESDTVRDGSSDWEDLSLAGINIRRQKKKPKSRVSIRPNEPTIQTESVTGEEEAVDSASHQNGRHAPPSGPEFSLPSGDPVVGGELDGVTTTRLLYHLWRGKRSGLLAIDGESGHRRIYVADGAPVQAESDDADALLGNLLISRGVVHRDQLEGVLSQAKQSGMKLAEALARLNLVAPHQLYHLLTEQLSEKLKALIPLTEGRWNWWPDVAPTEAPIPMTVDIPSVLIRGVHERLRTSFLRRFFEPYRKRLLVQMVKPSDMGRVQLSAKALRVINSIEPDDTVDTVVHAFTEKYRWSDAEIYSTLYLLTEFGVYRYANEAAVALP